MRYNLVFSQTTPISFIWVINWAGFYCIFADWNLFVWPAGVETDRDNSNLRNLLLTLPSILAYLWSCLPLFTDKHGIGSRQQSGNRWETAVVHQSIITSKMMEQTIAIWKPWCCVLDTNNMKNPFVKQQDFFLKLQIVGALIRLILLTLARTFLQKFLWSRSI